MADEPTLPPEITKGATLRGNEYGWSISSFPHALTKAEALGYACLGGTFEFRLDSGLGDYELYWLSVESEERAQGESWADYSRRSCTEVLQGFQRLISTTDFRKAASDQQLQSDLSSRLVFVAHFVTETTFAELASRISAL